jgi:DNA mismatch repair protein MutS2
MRINKDYVEKVGRRSSGKEERVHVEVTGEPDTGAGTVAPEINVRGMRVEDAPIEVDRFLDRAIVQGTTHLRILHGIGTGRLMGAIRRHLEEAAYVKDVRKDEKNSGVTVVELQ